LFLLLSLFNKKSSKYFRLWGKSNVILVPVQSNFKVDISKLSEYIKNLKENEYIAAVIGVFGSTEEGAIDYIHEIKFLRDKLQKEENISFWIHIDAAWGGYITSYLLILHYLKKHESKMQFRMKSVNTIK